MEKQRENKKAIKNSGKASGYFHSLTRHYSGPLAHVALSALSAWLIVTGLKGVLGFTVNSHTALADLIGIIIVVGFLRWMQLRQKTK